MTKEEALNKLNNYADKVNDEERKHLDMKRKEVNYLINEIQKLYPRIKDLYEIIQHTAEIKINNGMFFTDGISHDIGFYVDKIVIGALLCQNNNCYAPEKYFGIRGGGCCGGDLRINVDDGSISYVEHNTNKNIDITEYYSIYYMKSIINGFDNYEKKMYDYIQNL